MSEQATATLDETVTGSTGPTPAPEPAGMETKHVYMVLWAPVVDASEEEVRYREVGYYRGNAAQAKRKAMQEHRHLKAAAEAGGGIILRAVPAQSWPPEVEPTRYERPEPKLRIG